MYRSPDGLKCAIGAIIPDDRYNPEWENKTVCTLVLDDGQLDGIIDPSTVTLATHLQDAHDHVYNWATTVAMHEHLQEIAKEFELDASILETLSFSDR